MIEATWRDGVTAPKIDWRMSESLQNVPRSESKVAEVTYLERAVLDWFALDTGHKATAALTTEHAVQIGNASSMSFTGEANAAPSEHLPLRRSSEA